MVVTNISRKVNIDDITYVLIQKRGMMPDLIDERYTEAYRLMGRKAFIPMIVEHDDITPLKAMELARECIASKRK